MGFRVRGRWSGPIVFPNMCPNCLQSPAVKPLEIRRAFIAPVIAFPIALGYEFRLDFPHCADCIRFYAERTRLEAHQQWACWLGLAATAIPACAVIFATGVKETWLPAIMLALWIPVLAWQSARLRTRIRAIPSGQPRSTNKQAVRLVRAGRAVFSSEQVVDVVFSNAVYVKAFAEANADVARLKFPKDRVERAATRLEAVRKTT